MLLEEHECDFDFPRIFHGERYLIEDVDRQGGVQIARKVRMIVVLYRKVVGVEYGPESRCRHDQLVPATAYLKNGQEIFEQYSQCAPRHDDPEAGSLCCRVYCCATRSNSLLATIASGAVEDTTRSAVRVRASRTWDPTRIPTSC